LDHLCDFTDFVVVGILGGYGGWRTHSSAAGRCHHRRGHPGYSGTKMIIAIWTRKPAKEGDQF